MPIINEEDRKVAIFGIGDILMSTTRTVGLEHDNGMTLIDVGESHPLGEKITPEEFADRGFNEKLISEIPGAKVQIIFEKKASIQGMIDTLTELRDQFPDD